MSKVMFVSSGGGHWVQLKLLSRYLSCDTRFYVCTHKDDQLDGRLYTVLDCSLSEKVKLVRCFFQCLKIMRETRPSTIISTGAAPGILCIMIGRAFGINTIWIDSIANGEKLSLSGKIAKYFAHTCCSQWEDVAKKDGVSYLGRVL